MRRVFCIVSATFGLIAAAYPQTAVLYFTSAPGAWIGQGQTAVATPTNGFNILVSGTVAFSAFGTNYPHTNWFLYFGAPQAKRLTNGTYLNAHGQASADSPTLEFGGQGRGDNTSSGYFTVSEVSYGSNNTVLSFAADFVQYDGENPLAWNEGSVRYNSSIPIPKPLLLASLSNNAVTLIWPIYASSFKLFSTLGLTVPIAWSEVTNRPTTNEDGTLSILIPISAPRFFRLAR